MVTEINSDYRLDFLYDENNRLFGLVYNYNYKYFYVRDILNNILGLVDTKGNLVVKYSCDSFGNILSYSDTSGKGIASKNPFRFKGYYYDLDIDMYYCKSRFYVPKLRRWLNADSFDYLEPENIEGVNLFAYCANDPVNMYDPEGNLATLIIGALIGGLISSGVNIFSQTVFDGKSFSEIEWGKAGISFVSGFISGLVPGSGIFSMIGQAAISTAVDNVLMHAAYGDELSIKDVMTDFCLQVMTGLALKGLGKVTSKVTNKIFNKGNNYSQYQNYFRKKGLIILKKKYINICIDMVNI